LEQLFTPHSFDRDFPLISNAAVPAEVSKLLRVPEGTTRAHFLHWIEALPEVSTPTWLGLPDNAEVLVSTNKGKRVIGKLAKMQSKDAEDDTPANQQTKQDAHDPRPAWIRTLQVTVTQLHSLMPKPFQKLKRTAQNIKDPLFRCYEREVSTGLRLLNKVTHDLLELIEVCKGNAKQSNYMRSLMNSISKGITPKEWKWYATPDWVSLNQWISDFVRRMHQLDEISRSTDFRTLQIWLGGLLNPEAFITATRQSAAQSHGWSLENLKLCAESIAVKAPGETQAQTQKAGAQPDVDGFTMRGLSIEGASWSGNALALTNELSVPLAPIRFMWKNQENAATQASAQNQIAVPVYLSETRSELLFAIDLACPSTPPIQSWYQKSVALISWKLDL
jgi:dynein heavy chain 1